MITNGTKLRIVDNSGAIWGRCIKVLLPKSSKGRRFGYTGSVIIITVLQTIVGSKIKKGEMYKALIVQTRKEEKRQKIVNKRGSNLVVGKRSFISGDNRKYEENCAVLIKVSNKNDWTPIGSRIKKGKMSELIERNKKCSKIVSIC